MHIASPATHHIEGGFWRREGDGLGVAGGIDRQIVILNVISIWKVTSVPPLLRVSEFLMSVTTLWDMMICLGMRKGRIHHANGPDFESACKTTNELDIVWPIIFKWESKNSITDEIHYQNWSQLFHNSHPRSGQCSIRICHNDDCHAALTDASTSTTLHTDLVTMVEIFKIA